MSGVSPQRRLMLLLIIFAATVIACVPTPSESGSAENRIIYGLTLQPTGFDPHIHGSSELGIPLRMVYDTLIYRDPSTQSFVPGLASSWEISPDGLTYTFSLREDVFFHDGSRFNAAAVGANLDRIVNPNTASQRAVFMLGTYQRYEVADEFTIRLILAQPYAPLLDSLSQVYIGMASPQALNEFNNERYQFHQIGTGPYRFVEYVPGDRLVIERNDDYSWGPAFYTPPSEQTPAQIEFRFFTDAASRSIALESGDVQIIGELPPIDARALTANSSVQLNPVAIPGQPLQFLINTNRYPTNDVRVRQALLFATNREAIIDAVFQRFSPIAWGPLAATTGFFNRDLVGAYAFDLARAQTLLSQAGFVDSDGNGILEFNGVEIEVNLIVPPWGLIPEVAQLLQDQWRVAGIRAVLNPVPSRNTLIEAVNTGNYNLVAFYEFGLDPSFLSRYFATGGVNNWTNFSDATLDQMLTEAERQTDTGARSSLYGQAQLRIMEQALILPIRDYVNLNANVTGIGGLSYDAYGWFPLLTNVTVSGPISR